MTARRYEDMNCKEYREAIAGDPAESFAGGGAHAAGCAACSRYRDDIRELDLRIASALAIDVPPLEDLELPPPARQPGTVVDFPGKRPGRAAGRSLMPAWLGIAAGLVIAAFVGITLLSPDTSGGSLAEQVIAHMDHEQASRRVTTVAVPEQRLLDVMNPKVAAPGVSGMNADIGLVTYAQSCVINGNTVPHLVVQGKSGPVTLILLPEETIGEAIPLSGEYVHGVIVPVGSGSVAIIGERAEQLDEIGEMGQRIVESVEWQI